MRKLENHIESVWHYKNRFDTWDATEQIIDDNKAFWMLKDPKSSIQKVCLFRDGRHMVIYGDYGSMVFDQMTWLGSVYNLDYDNIRYQMEKLSHDSRENLKVFDSEDCMEDFIEWLDDYLISQNTPKEHHDIIKNYAKEIDRYTADYDIEYFCEYNDLEESIQKILLFAMDAMNHMEDNDEWYSFLRNSNLRDFDEPCESLLWRAGQRIDQRYFINMYALKICAEKLEAQKRALQEEL